MTPTQCKAPPNIAVSFWIFFIFVLPMQCQTLTASAYRWVKTPMSDLDVAFLAPDGELENTSVVQCAVRCATHGSCLSFSVNRTSRRCLIYRRRTAFGVGMQMSPGSRLSHYWRIFSQCPDDYVYKSGQHVCFKPMGRLEDRLSWSAANNACMQDGGHLYIPNTQAKMDIITQYIEDGGYENLQFKLGGNDLFEEGHFRWLDGSEVTYWYTSQPDNRDGVQHCVENTRSHPSFLSDGKCESLERYICQIPMG